MRGTVAENRRLRPSWNEKARGESRAMTRFSRSSWRRESAIGAGTALAVGALASIAAAVSTSGAPAAASQYADKVTICHHTHSQKHPFVTITVSRNALPAHLRHGDMIGSCAAASIVGNAPSHGKSGQHRKKTEKAKTSAGIPRGDGGTAPGKSESSSGHVGSTAGHSGTPPAQSGNSPGHNGSAPGHNGSAPGHSGTAPGHSGTAPGHSGTSPG